MVTLEKIMAEYVKVNFKELPRFFSEADQKDLYKTGFIRNSVKRGLDVGDNQLAAGARAEGGSFPGLFVGNSDWDEACQE